MPTKTVTKKKTSIVKAKAESRRADHAKKKKEPQDRMALLIQKFMKREKLTEAEQEELTTRLLLRVAVESEHICTKLDGLGEKLDKLCD